MNGRQRVLDFLEGKPVDRLPLMPVVMGNLDPVRTLRNGASELVTAALAACHRQAGDRYIVGAGCEVPRDTPLENVRALAAYARHHGDHSLRS
jgi:uroporphyrinogen-III decarboxylase